MRYSELREKEVVNVLDGRRLGTIIDIDLNVHEGKILSITVPGPTKWTRLLRGDRTGLDIPWHKVCKIGDDVILVEVDPSLVRAIPD